MAAHSTKPVCLAALILAALLLAVLPAPAQMTRATGASGEDAGGAVEVPALPDPLTRQAIRDVSRRPDPRAYTS